MTENQNSTENYFASSDNKPIVAMGILLGLLFVLWLISSIFSDQGKYLTPHEFADNAHIFESLEINASSAIVYDILRGEFLFEKAADEVMPLASITKVMTALVAREIGGKEKAIITREAIYMEGDSGLLLGETWDISSLMDFNLLTSSNDGTRAVASALGAFIGDTESLPPEEYFIQRMNTRAAEIGLDSMRFYNDTGLDLSYDTAGAFGSARDLAKLFAFILENDDGLLSATRYEEVRLSSEQMAHLARNTNRLAASLPSLIGGKTGFTDLSGGNLAVVFDAGIQRPVVVVVLGSGADTRFDDVALLVEKTLEYIKQ